MKILITGGLGFIGSHLAVRLVAEGHDVHIYDNESNAKVKAVVGATRCHDFRYQQWDLVYHLAAVAQIEQGYNYDVVNSNILLSREVMNLPCRVIYASSAAVKQPKTLYAFSKMDNDHYASTRSNCFGVRFENVYGLHDNGVIGKVLNACIYDRPFTLNGGHQTRDFVYIDDVVDRLVLDHINHRYSDTNVDGCLHKKIQPIGTGVAHSIIDVIAISERITTMNIDTATIKPLADHEIVHSVCETPLKTFTNLEDGMQKYYLALTV